MAALPGPNTDFPAHPQRGDNLCVASADMKIGLQRPEPEIEQDAAAVFLA